MPKSSTYANQLLRCIFLNEDITLIGDAAGIQNSATAGSLYIGLHTADPGAAGNQTTNEATYTGYARKAVARTAGGWTVTGNLVQNAALITFDQCSAGSNSITHWSIGTDSSGAGKVLYYGALGTVVQGPFTAAASDTITIPGHTLAVDERCSFYSAFGSTLPTGITEGTIYWVKTVSGDNITISTTQGGATLDITAVGDGVVFEAQVVSVSALVTPEIAAGQINLIEG